MWFGTRGSEVQILSQRRSLVRDLITTFRESMRSPFPRWIARRALAIEKEWFVNQEH
jgi:hypothetical protein